MNKIILLVIIVVLGVGALLFKGKPQKPTAPATVQDGRIIIAMTENGYSPDAVTIPVGTTVEFANKDIYWHWPASDPHPTHSFYPEIDPKEPIKPGASWNVVLDKSGAWGIHDHLAPYQTGVITVTP